MFQLEMLNHRFFYLLNESSSQEDRYLLIIQFHSYHHCHQFQLLNFCSSWDLN